MMCFVHNKRTKSYINKDLLTHVEMGSQFQKEKYFWVIIGFLPNYWAEKRAKHLALDFGPCTFGMNCFPPIGRTGGRPCYGMISRETEQGGIGPKKSVPTFSRHPQ